jgi:hypothetical protein
MGVERCADETGPCVDAGGFAALVGVVGVFWPPRLVLGAGAGPCEEGAGEGEFGRSVDGSGVGDGDGAADDVGRCDGGGGGAEDGAGVGVLLLLPVPEACL